jgi:rod shape-determining protein MreC
VQADGQGPTGNIRGRGGAGDAADPHTRKVIIDKGLFEGVDMGSLWSTSRASQVTRVSAGQRGHRFSIVDREFAIPVLNVHRRA